MIDTESFDIIILYEKMTEYLSKKNEARGKEMLLSELQPGASIVLEIVFGKKKFEIPLTVEKTEQFAIYTNTFRYGGTVVDFSKKGFEHLLFNVYASDIKSQGRFVWKGLMMQLVTLRGVSYYKLQCKNILQQGTSLNRRGEKRMVVDIQGQAFSMASGEISYVAIHDVSSQGISFFANENFAEEGEIMDLRFVDEAADKKFDIRIEVQCVRIVPKNATMVMYGCKVRNPGRDYQTYVYFKKLMEQKKDKGTE